MSKTVVKDLEKYKGQLAMCTTEEAVLELESLARQFYTFDGFKLLTRRQVEVIILNLIENPERTPKRAQDKYLSIVHNKNRKLFIGGSHLLWQHADKIAMENWVERENSYAQKRAKKASTTDKIRSLILHCPHGAQYALEIYKKRMRELENYAM